MTDTVKLNCACGTVKGELVIDSKQCIHVQCYCCDCQAFANYLDQSDLLDENGGSDLLQTYPNKLRITQGSDQIDCLKVTIKGKLRWFTKCCQTPIGNTMSNPKVPFVGVSVNFMQFEEEHDKPKMLGPVFMKAFGKDALGTKPADAHETYPLKYVAKLMGFMIKGMITKQNKPSAFKPVQVCKVLK